jgi:hypothetical protein
MDSTQESTNSRFTIDDVFKVLEQLNEIRERSSALDFRKTPDSPVDNSYEDEVQKVVDSWEANRDAFKFVFETEMGSKYFVLDNGMVVRFKRKDDKWDIRRINISEHIVFLDEKTFNELLETEKYGGGLQEEIFILSKRPEGIPASEEPSEGLYPFDFRAYRYANDISYTIENGVLRITDKLGPFASGNHFGHKITKVL